MTSRNIIRRLASQITNGGLAAFDLRIVSKSGLERQTRTFVDQIERIERKSIDLESIALNRTPCPYVSPAVRQALNLREEQVVDGAVQLNSIRQEWQLPPTTVTSRDLFFENGTALPCWQDSDLKLIDDWLINSRYYPAYYSVFRDYIHIGRPVRFLEIGVRTGYIGAVLARAYESVPVFYAGVDPNLYVSDGLQLASATFQYFRSLYKGFDFCLFQGYSWDYSLQRSLLLSGPYDIIHIDGDHTLVPKLIDLDLARSIISPEGFVLVDDYEHHRPVAEAITRAFALGWYKGFTYVSTLRGLAILTC